MLSYDFSRQGWPTVREPLERGAKEFCKPSGALLLGRGGQEMHRESLAQECNV